MPESCLNTQAPLVGAFLCYIVSIYILRFYKMSHSFLIVPTEAIPQWTKDNIPTYNMARFSKDGQFLLLDNAHTVGTYKAWLGPNFHLLEQLIDMSTLITFEEFKQMESDINSIWYVGDYNE